MATTGSAFRAINIENITNFSGITSTSKKGCKIEKCAIGNCKKEIKWKGRIVGKIEEKSVLANNISIDSNQSSLDKVHDGESVSAILFNQRYFENTLGWDFDTVWIWDDQKKHPVLRQVGVQADTSGTFAAHHATSAEANTTDLLTQQIRANLWL